jgi:hypothetical protein
MLFILYFSSFNDIEISANFFLEKSFYESSILKYVTSLFNKNIRHLPISLDYSRVKIATAVVARSEATRQSHAFGEER